VVVVEVAGVSKKYGNVTALEDVSFEVKRGEMFCVMGPNGAGKTTLLEGILGLRRLDRGTVRLFGVEVRGRPPFDVLRRVGYLLEGMDLDPALTAWENLRLVAAVGGVKTSDGELRAVLEAVGALEYAKRLYGKLSAGQKKRVLLAAALLGRPELLILDEPEANLDVASRLEIMDLVKRLAAGGVTVLFSTHAADIAVRYADRIAMLNRKILAVGSVEELVARFGGRWKVVVRTKRQPAGQERDGGLYVTYVNSPAEVAEVLRGVEALEISVHPPDLGEVFRKIWGS
jgi:ABC-2 type transport system ATP-binding protein